MSININHQTDSIDPTSETLSISATGSLGLPVGTTAQRPASPTVGMIRYNSTLKVNEVYTESQITAGTYAWRAVPTGDTIIQASTNGEATYTQPGTYTWTCPAGVTAVNVVCVGGGGGSPISLSAGGGGGLAWCNNIPVTPGTQYTVVVGQRGTASTVTTSGTQAGSGGDSYFINTSTIVAYGGQGGIYTGNTSVGGGGFFVTSAYGSSGGGTGGSGGSSNSATYNPGGGGAGGYAGSGGYGASYGGAYGSPGAGSGGGGGGGAAGGSTAGGGGGGVGIYGQGTNGTAGTGNGSTATRGGGGSGGVGGGTLAAIGGDFGGGASPDSNYGGSGAVRIIWGPNRAFPSTNTGTL